ncbi:MAG: SRPBCC family protein [Saprospiraceae bacterium]|nr:SRPBCC family protein [Saprospiraceae bacterium]
MKVLKFLGIALAALVGLVLLAGLFVKKDYAVERSIVINKPKADVFSYVRVFKNHKNFSSYEQMDPNIKMDYRGTDGEVGSVSAWAGNSNVGKGEQEIKKITEGERIDIELRFIEPMASIAPCYWTFESVDSTQTKVKWGMSGTMSYPMNTMQLVMSMDDMIGTEYQKGLNQLKAILEK